MSEQNSNSKDYKNSGGVDTRLADQWVERLQDSAKKYVNAGLASKMKSGIGDYASVYELSSQQWVATSCDGVGTKLLWTLEGLGRVEDLACDLLAMNANDVLCVGAKPTLFLDYLALGSHSLLEKGGLLENFVGALQKLCFESGQMLVGGETAQMPDLYQGKHFDLAGFSVGFLEPEQFLSIENVQVGAELWAWPSSGPHSNGYSWLRKIFDSTKDKSFIEQHLMKPTKLYVNEFLDFQKTLTAMNELSALQAAFHITGSGYLNLVRAQPKGRSLGFDLCEWNFEKELPMWVSELRKRSGATLEELATSFNCGWGMILVLDQKFTSQNLSVLQKFGLRKLGKVTDGDAVLIPGLKPLTE